MWPRRKTALSVLVLCCGLVLVSTFVQPTTGEAVQSSSTSYVKRSIPIGTVVGVRRREAQSNGNSNDDDEGDVINYGKNLNIDDELAFVAVEGEGEGPVLSLKRRDAAEVTTAAGTAAGAHDADFIEKPVTVAKCADWSDATFGSNTRGPLGRSQPGELRDESLGSLTRSRSQTDWPTGMHARIG
ncbi:uncharacterized protein LOC129743198 [Uranotaenia lowii]|uniref:uncharacterized protein LOC129743198 n=1 Tax=Uranotaenia lowii TaxID=190385 RepID=UPI002479F0C2|nr:uncharacterized protein LOC129743198 [Uranotaenia lowii]